MMFSAKPDWLLWVVVCLALAGVFLSGVLATILLRMVRGSRLAQHIALSLLIGLLVVGIVEICKL